MELEKLQTPEDIGNYIDSKQKELQSMIMNRETIEAEINNISRQILELRIKKSNLNTSLSKSKSNCAFLALEIKRANQKFWRTKNI